ncbi:MAG TPA: hypothetical protein VGO08_02295, partial [Burkholderiales bacterium]|nr:hypothetical protein [Burkholderiales bacterium]
MSQRYDRGPADWGKIISEVHGGPADASGKSIMGKDAHQLPHERVEQVLALIRAKVAKDEQAALERFVREY